MRRANSVTGKYLVDIKTLAMEYGLRRIELAQENFVQCCGLFYFFISLEKGKMDFISLL